MRGPSYLGLTRSISWLLMPWLLMSPGQISSHDIDYVEYVGPCLTWGRILSTCVISIWSNDIKCKYMFVFPLKNLARKELKQHSHVRHVCSFPGDGSHGEAEHAGSSRSRLIGQQADGTHTQDARDSYRPPGVYVSQISHPFKSR